MPEMVCQRQKGNSMFNLGPQELIIILLIVVVLFGAKRLPQLGAGLGKGIKNFKQGMKDDGAEPLDDKDNKDA